MENNSPLITVIKQENPMELDETSAVKTIINITLYKPNIFDNTNSARGKKVVQNSGKDFDSSSISSSQCLNSNQSSLQKHKCNISSSRSSVKLEPSVIQPELLEATRTSVRKVDENQNSGEYDKCKDHADLRSKRLARHHNAKKCSKCKKSFSQRSNLWRHSKICSKSDDFISSLMFSCNHCNYKTVEKGYLTKHMQAKHLPHDLNANKCKKCKKIYSWRTDLIKHSKICGLSKDQIRSLWRYTCYHCNYKTNHKSNLAEHIQRKHLPRDPNAYKCNKCKKSFSSRYTLWAHSKICGKSKDQILLLSRYTCYHCNYKTNRKSNLTTHIQRKHLPRNPDTNK